MRAACALVLGALLWLPAAVLADDAPPSFSSAALALRYDALIGELRCLVCQNQTLKDSHAELAQDLRDQVRQQLEHGDSDEQIRAYLVARYGDFVLYSPPLKASTWLLWLGPFVLLLGALAVVLRLTRHRSAVAVPLDDAERARLGQALADSDQRS